MYDNTLLSIAQWEHFRVWFPCIANFFFLNLDSFFIKVVRWPWFSFLKYLKHKPFLPGSKVIWHQKWGESPVFRVWNQHFFNFTTSLWETLGTYIFSWKRSDWAESTRAINSNLKKSLLLQLRQEFGDHTYIFVVTIFLGIFRAIGIGLHSRDFNTLKWFHVTWQARSTREIP